MTVKPAPDLDAVIPAFLREEHKTALRRLLIAWTRDIDVADDLLQGTYLRAQACGIPTAGGHLHAWLTTIAKNVCYSHYRKQRGAESFDEQFMGVTTTWAGSSEASGNVFVIREAIHALPPPLQQALMLRHYGEFSDHQIAEHCHCPIGTARQRVWTAIQHLRQRLCSPRKEEKRMSGHQVNGIQLLEYLYGVLPADQRADVTAQLAGCEEAQQELQQLREVMSSLNHVAGDFVLLYLVEWMTPASPAIIPGDG